MSDKIFLPNFENNNSDEETAVAKTKGTPTRLLSLRPRTPKKIAANTSSPKVTRSKSIPVEDIPTTSNNAKTGRRGIAPKWATECADVPSDSDEALIKVKAKMTLTPSTLAAKVRNIRAGTSSPRCKSTPLDQGPSSSNIAEVQRRATIRQRKSAYVDALSDNGEKSTPTKKTPRRPTRESANKASQTPEKVNKTTGTTPSTKILRTKKTKRGHTNVSSDSNEEEPVKNANAKRPKIPTQLLARNPVLKNQMVRGTDIVESSPKIVRKKSNAPEEGPSTSSTVPERRFLAKESKRANTDDEPTKITTATMTESSAKFLAKETLEKSQTLGKTKTVDATTSYEQIISICNTYYKPAPSEKPSVSKTPPKSPATKSSEKPKILNEIGNVPTSYAQKEAAPAVRKTYSFAAPEYVELSKELNICEIIRPSPVSMPVSNAGCESVSSSSHPSCFVSPTSAHNSFQSFTSAKYTFSTPYSVTKMYGRPPSSYTDTSSPTTSSNINKSNDNTDAELLSEEEVENEIVVDEDNPIGRNIQTPFLSEFSRKLRELNAPPLRYSVGSTTINPRNSTLVYENLAYQRRIRARYTGAGAGVAPGSADSANTTNRHSVEDDAADDSEFLSFIMSLDEKYYIKEIFLFILFLIIVAFAYVF